MPCLGRPVRRRRGENASIVSPSVQSRPLGGGLDSRGKLLAGSLFKSNLKPFCQAEMSSKAKSNKDSNPRFERIRRLKKWMRPLPRRSNVHRYPILKWFSKTAYDRSYLWSFRGKTIIPALFWGLWIAMLPIVGLQMLVVFLLAILLRANLPVSLPCSGFPIL